MLDDALKTQLKTHLERITRPFELVASYDDSEKSRELTGLLADIVQLCPLIHLREDGNAERRPSFAFQRDGQDLGVAFAGIPLGHEFTSLVLALLQAGGHPPRVEESVLEQIRAIEGEHRFETYYSLSCQVCPEVVQALNLMALVHPDIHHTAIDGALFQDEVEQREVMAVPAVFRNGEPFEQGRMELEQIIGRLDHRAADRVTESMTAMEPFDLLVVGGGPAGAAAAIYAARKGIRTGMAAERPGGQLQDTLTIENFISVPTTEGPQLARQLEEHVRSYPVEMLPLQRAEALHPASEPGGLHRVDFANGASLQARSVVLATGARWRELNVPGEQEYRTRGVAYCPHCDGPLFKGKRVAVIGGGNSGVEAAIDLAGITAQVTLIEFEEALRADAVLQRKLATLGNVEVITGALTTEVLGDGRRVTGLAYQDRETEERRTLNLDGIFVQIGLVPNTAWLQGAVELSRHGEIVVDSRGQTSVPGIHAAGDVTTTPYKQIVVAMGDGATAALSAFDYLIRNS